LLELIIFTTRFFIAANVEKDIIMQLVIDLNFDFNLNFDWHKLLSIAKSKV
jgi:hypothetical protein